MNARVRRWPSFGFWFVLGSWSLLVGFLSWGFSQPELDRVWEINQRMQLLADIAGAYQDKGAQ